MDTLLVRASQDRELSRHIRQRYNEGLSEELEMLVASLYLLDKKIHSFAH
jgi:hypothetical protein